MNNNDDYYNKYLSPKLRVNIYNILIQPLESKDPLSKLIGNFSEIQPILVLGLPKITKILYFNKYNIHYILYESEETIEISSNKLENNLCNYFYLYLLIKDNPNIINYIYDADLIIKLNITNKNINFELKKIIYSKIIIELIDNYMAFDEENNIMNTDLEKIRQDNLNIIEKNIYILKDYNLNLNINLFLSEKLDIIYINLICEIIKNKKSENYENAINILNQLEIEDIDLTKNMVDALYCIINIDNHYIKEKMIINENDLLNNEKINFYYILLKYILKKSIYIYQFPFLLKTKYYIIQIIKSNNFKDNIFNEKIYYIIKTIIDSEYYLNIIKKSKKNNWKINNKNKPYQNTDYNDNASNSGNDSLNKINKGNNILEQNINSQITMEETQKNIIENSSNKIENISNNTKNDLILKNKNYLENLIKIIKSSSVNYTLNKCENKQNDKINYKYLTQLIINKNNYNDFGEYINCKKYIDFIKEFDDIIKSEYNNKEELDIDLNFKEDKKNQNKNEIINITCEYYFKKMDRNYRDENILINGLNQGFEALLCDIKYG